MSIKGRVQNLINRDYLFSLVTPLKGVLADLTSVNFPVPESSIYKLNLTNKKMYLFEKYTIISYNKLEEVDNIYEL